MAAQTQSQFTASLKKYYSFYTGGFVAFVIALAILEQLGVPNKWLGYLFLFATVALYAGIGIMSRTTDAAEYYVAGRRVPAIYNGMATAKRNVDLACLDRKEPELSGSAARQRVTVRQGIDTDTARRIVKDTKEAKLKVQAQIQGEQVRITGKQRDDLQQVIALLRGRDYQLPLQFINFRD